MNRSLSKKRVQNIRFYTLTNTSFISLKEFAWTTPKNTKSPITLYLSFNDSSHLQPVYS